MGSFKYLNPHWFLTFWNPRRLDNLKMAERSFDDLSAEETNYTILSRIENNERLLDGEIVNRPLGSF